MFESISTCIGCGCNDCQGCWDEAKDQPCSWLVVDRTERLGVCSVCPGDLERWKAGDRRINVPTENLEVGD